MKLTSIIANKCNFYKSGGCGDKIQCIIYAIVLKTCFLKMFFHSKCYPFVLWSHFATLSCVQANSGISLDAVLLTYADI